jgi:hypothetical protein
VVRRSEVEMDKSSRTDRARMVVSTIRCRNGLWLQLMRCALHYAWSPISEQRSEEYARGVDTILVDIQTELQLRYRSLFIVVYKTKGDIR